MGQAMQQQYEKAQDKQGNKLAQSKGRDNRKWIRWRQGFVTEVPSLARSTSPFGEGEEHNAHTKPTRAILFILMLLPKQDVVIPLLGHLRAVTEPVQMATLGAVPEPVQMLGAISTTELEAPVASRSFPPQ